LFLLKKIVGPLFFPLPLCLEILLIGLFLLWLTKKQRAGKIVVSIGTVLLAGLSFGLVSDALLRPLENKYPPQLEIDGISDVKWVVVLGGGHRSDPKVPVSSQISGGSLARLVEGIRLQRKLPQSKLILSGGGAFDPIPNANIMADVALAIGVDKEHLILEQSSKDTKDQAILIKELVGEDRFALVTSASHMPRSMALFRKQGMNPIPVPTDHRVKERQGSSPRIFFPNATDIGKAERALYEYLGLIWAKLRGQI
jgi:uncharacterized SAM-binding protein YcdF (DUF218 family)